MQMLLKDGKKLAFTLSYDDTTVSNNRFLEIINRYGLKCTFNLNSKRLVDQLEADGKIFDGTLTVGEAKKLYLGNGHEIAAHCLTHPWIADLPKPEMIYEVTEDRKNLEGIFDVIVRGMAYPYGCFNDKTVDALQSSGIVYSRTTLATRKFDFPENWLTLHPTCHHEDANLFDIAKSFVEDSPKWGRCKLFYLWGHSFEFDRNNNWERLEKICEYISGRDNVWYATNIEIYDYVKAYERLEVSYDKTLVHNPSAITVWFTEGGKAYEIKPGESIVL